MADCEQRLQNLRKSSNNTIVLLQAYLDNILSIAIINAEGKFGHAGSNLS